MMKYILLVVLLFGTPVAHAYNPISVHTDKPFEEIGISLSGQGINQSYLGELEGYPDMFEFILEEDAAIEVQIKQRNGKSIEPANVILVSVHPDTQRISEVVRINTPLEDRITDFVWSLGITEIKSEGVQLDLEAGQYRLEVSMPINEGPYELDFGIEGNDNSYFGTYGTVWQVQRHYGYWYPRYFLSSYILYQIGIVVMIGGFLYMRRKHNQTTDAT